MLVQQLLDAKSEVPVVTIAPDAPLSNALNILADKRIGALVVSETGDRADGILSERDIVRAIARQGNGCLGGNVRDLMTDVVVTCSPDTTVEKVTVAMTTGRFRHMPVVDGDKMIGVISIGDVVKARMDELGYEKAALQDMIMGR